MNNTDSVYQYLSAEPTWSNHYLWPVLKDIINQCKAADKRVFELGCGNGATSKYLEDLGFEVTGVDASESGISIANEKYREISLYVGSAYDDLVSIYGQFPIVVSLEVIEHCFYPRQFAKTFYDLLEDGGLGIISTPYHGYWKNLVLAITGKLDSHFTALWDGGHIKFFSEKTLRELLLEAGFSKVTFERVGRFPLLAKSMIAIVQK